MERVRLGIIGLGCRGISMLQKTFITYTDVDIVALCDVYDDRTEKAADIIEEKRGVRPFCTADYKEVLALEDIDAVYIATSWESHIEISIAALYAGIICASEVGGAYSADECIRLVRAYEETKTPYMLMENCCFNGSEILATSAVRHGMLGTVVHCSGAYAHDLREEISHGNINRHYRLRNYLSRNCENYPTHELGPIARILNITRGNRSLVSVASKACGLEEYIRENKIDEKDEALKGVRFAQGDIVDTIITCAGGETVHLRLDTTLPRSYSRALSVRGTKGLYDMDTHSFFLDGMKEDFNTLKYTRGAIGNAEDYVNELMPTEWIEKREAAEGSGHGGMDGIMARTFIDAVKSGAPMPIDVYDAVTWMSISYLTEISIAQGGLPQAIPDFTNGAWLLRHPEDVMNLC